MQSPAARGTGQGRAMDIDRHTEELLLGWNPPTLDEINEIQSRGPKLMRAAAFVTGFTPPDYLIDGILQRRFIYAFTGRTGEGKTSVCLRLAAHVSEEFHSATRRSPRGACSISPARIQTIFGCAGFLLLGANGAGRERGVGRFR